MGLEGMLDVSPLQRHWGGALRISDVGAKKRLLSNSMAAPSDDEDTPLFGPGAALEPTGTDAAAGNKKAGKATDEATFELTMYRLNRKTLNVETMKRSYATAAAEMQRAPSCVKMVTLINHRHRR